MFHRALAFVPILAGATLKDRLVACLGTLLAITLTGLLCALARGTDGAVPLMVAPVGASAVLLFAVPASPLAQPWSIVGGNTISALVGVLVARLVPDLTLASGLAVSLAILAMSFTRSLHPPGGATALTAVIGGSAVTSAGFLYPLVPVALNSVVLVLLGVGFHRLSGRLYPHIAATPRTSAQKTADVPASLRLGFTPADVDAALAAANETFDIDRDDLDALLRRIELQAILRQHGDLTCALVMSRDVVSIPVHATPAAARELLLRHNIRTLPVVDPDGRLVGVAGLRELQREAASLGELMSRPATALPEQSALSLLPTLTDGRSHAVVITDPDSRVAGLITQTDLLAAAGRLLQKAS
ncbi:MAG TPA: HPP family protein [Tianweitania sediminis]|nr:HPP family protein [Tianweitania sediminis]